MKRIELTEECYAAARRLAAEEGLTPEVLVDRLIGQRLRGQFEALAPRAWRERQRGAEEDEWQDWREELL